MRLPWNWSARLRDYPKLAKTNNRVHLGTLGTGSYIARGKGNPKSFESCSHGAGRVMSRGEAKRRFTLADHRAATEVSSAARTRT